MSSEVVQIYHSRESRVGDLCEEEDRVQLEDAREDVEKLKSAFGILFEQTDDLDSKGEDYMLALLDEDGYNYVPIRTARNELIESWANAQLALSRLAWVLRLDGNDAYQRMVNARKHGLVVDMSDL